MAALVIDSAFDLAAFRAHVVQRLPSYARPVFLRILQSLETTGTFKTHKQALLRAGYDPQATTDPLFVDDAQAGSYVPLDAARYAAIQAGRVRI
jgi:fatty-acyl-CoA synthase